MSHRVIVTTTYDDGHQSAWVYHHRPGTAQDAHDALAKRWRAAGYTFDRDRAAMKLTRVVTSRPELGDYTDEIVHEEQG